MENMSVRIRLVAPALIIGASLIGAVYLGAGTAYKIKALSRTLSVTGSADKVIKSDTVKWTSHITRQVSTDKLADGSRQLRQDLEAAESFLKETGIAETAVTVQPVTVSTVCNATNYYGKGCPEGTNAGYVLEQSLMVESGDVDRVTDGARKAAGALLEKNVVFTTDSLEYYYSKLADLKLDMLSQATSDAKSRAERIVGSTGGKLGPIQSASMGVFQVTAVNSTEISDYGAYDTSAVEKKITAVVRTTFSLE